MIQRHPRIPQHQIPQAHRQNSTGEYGLWKVSTAGSLSQRVVGQIVPVWFWNPSTGL